MALTHIDYLEGLEMLVPKALCGTRMDKDSFLITSWGDSRDQPSDSDIATKVSELQESKLIRFLREQRNILLTETDWRDLPSYAGTKQAEWRVYRQDLRDITSGLDTVDKVNAVTWPEKPE
jgi:hypothetical protein